MKKLKGRVVVEGTAEGEAIVSSQPFGFFGGVDPTTGLIIDAWHDLSGENIKFLFSQKEKDQLSVQQLFLSWFAHRAHQLQF